MVDVVRQYAALEVHQLRAGLEPKLRHEAHASRLVGGEGVLLATCTVEGKHQRGEESFAERVDAHEAFELADELRSPPEREIGADALLDCEKPPLIEPWHLGGSKRLVEQVGEGFAAPKRQRLAKSLRSVGRIPTTELLAAPLEEHLKVVDIQLAGLRSDEIARRAPLDSVGAEHAAKSRDIAVEAPRSRSRSSVAPEPFDQSVTRHDLVRTQEEHCEERSRLRPAEIELLSVEVRLDRAEERELHGES